MELTENKTGLIAVGIIILAIALSYLRGVDEYGMCSAGLMATVLTFTARDVYHKRKNKLSYQ